MSSVIRTDPITKRHRFAASAELSILNERIGTMKKYVVKVALRAVASSPGPNPPNHAVKMTAGKKVMNGAIGPKRLCRRDRRTKATATAQTATLYLSHARRG